MFKKNIDRLTKHLAIIIVVVTALIMGYIIYELSITKQKVATALVDKSLLLSHDALKDFFDPIKKQLLVTRKQFEMKQVVSIDTLEVLNSFIPVLINNPQLKSMAVANERGKEFDILRGDSPYYWKTRLVDPDISKVNEYWCIYRIDEQYKIVKDTSWISEDYKNPINRPWFQGALNSIDDKTLYWTSPYMFSTTNQIGITVSTGWEGESSENWKLTAFDLSTEVLNDFTQHIRPSENGLIMIVTGDHKYVVGLPPSNEIDELRRDRILELSDIPNEELIRVLEIGKENVPISFSVNGQNWWGASRHFYLSDEQSYKVVIALPEKDFLAEVNESQKLIVGGFFGILLLSILILRSHNAERKNSQLLFKKNNEILVQNDVIASKNEEIMDSINYAQRIQYAILPSQKIIKKSLPNSFVLFEPKDVVAGDFYWLEKTGDYILFAAADCTGHGVPGAMVSVMCHNALNRSIKEHGLIKANDILDKTRELVIKEFSQSESIMSDGMDVSLCILDTKLNKLHWAGANNPLWIIRAKNTDIIEEIKPDKQPIGNYLEMKPFTGHEVQLEKGDLIYVFSDGYKDQFGGPKGKKLKIATMRKLLLQHHSLELEQQKEKLVDFFNDWMGDLEQVDDVCVIGVRL